MLRDYGGLVCFLISTLSPQSDSLCVQNVNESHENLCNNVAEIGRRVKTSDSVWLDCKSVLEKRKQYVSCEISIYMFIVPNAF